MYSDVHWDLFVDSKVYSEIHGTGVGFCNEAYCGGWDGLGLDSQESCNAVCMADVNCRYAAWHPNTTCARYCPTDGVCTLNGNTAYTAYKKVYTKNESIGLNCGTMINGRGCSSEGEYKVGNADNAADCVPFCEKQNLAGCCEWQHDWKKCMYQPRDTSTSVSDKGRST